LLAGAGAVRQGPCRWPLPFRFARKADPIMALTPMRRTTIAAALIALGWTAVAPAADPSPALQQLRSQAEFWDARQDARAIEAWQRVLAVDPKDIRALSRLAVLTARSGQTAAANGWLDKLRAAGASQALVDRTTLEIGAG